MINNRLHSYEDNTNFVTMYKTCFCFFLTKSITAFSDTMKEALFLTSFWYNFIDQVFKASHLRIINNSSLVVLLLNCLLHITFVQYRFGPLDRGNCWCSICLMQIESICRKPTKSNIQVFKNIKSSPKLKARTSKTNQPN